MEVEEEKRKVLEELDKIKAPAAVKAAMYASKIKELQTTKNSSYDIQINLSQDIYNKNGLHITAYIKDNKLDIEYYDLGGPYGDYERHLTLTEDATQKLCEMYQCNIGCVLNKLKELFPDGASMQYFQDFCDKHELKYQTFTFTE